MLKANYWASLFFNGIVLGIYPAAALAMIVSHYPLDHGTAEAFITVFVINLLGFVLIIMCLYHYIIVPRRRARGRQTRR